MLLWLGWIQSWYPWAFGCVYMEARLGCLHSAPHDQSRCTTIVDLGPEFCGSALVLLQKQCLRDLRGLTADILLAEAGPRAVPTVYIFVITAHRVTGNTTNCVPQWTALNIQWLLS